MKSYLSYNLKEMIDIMKNYKFKINLIDIDSDLGVMSIDKIKEKISNKTAATISYTNMFNDYEHAETIKKLCEENDILLIEDCSFLVTIR